MIVFINSKKDEGEAYSMCTTSYLYYLVVSCVKKLQTTFIVPQSLLSPPPPPTNTAILSIMTSNFVIADIIH